MKPSSIQGIHRPIAAIIGRPNVGKSTLFNRLVGRRDAIVDDFPGVTRDRHYAPCDVHGRYFSLVDTGGLDPTASSGIIEQVRRQSEKAIEEADVLIVLFDGRDGVTPLDEEIVAVLRRKSKPVLYAVNKIDTPRQNVLMSDFYRLGVKPLLPISAESGTGIEELLQEMVREAPVSEGEPAEKEAAARVPGIAVVGRPNVGKSTFINRLLGEERMITDATPGTTRDAVDTEVTYGKRTYRFIDTAGIRRRGKIDPSVERYSISRALSAIERADVAVVLLDGGEGVVEQDTKIIGQVIQSKKGCIVIVNKWDLHEGQSDAQARVRAGLNRKLGFIPFAPVVFISALEGFKPEEIFRLLDDVIRGYTFRVSTGELNRAFEKALAANTPPSQKGRTTRLYYMTQARTSPPTFVVFCNYPARVKESYRRYLENFLRQSFPFVGTPLELVFRQRKRTPWEGRKA